MAARTSRGFSHPVALFAVYLRLNSTLSSLGKTLAGKASKSPHTTDPASLNAVGTHQLEAGIGLLLWLLIAGQTQTSKAELDEILAPFAWPNDYLHLAYRASTAPHRNGI